MLWFIKYSVLVLFVTGGLCHEELRNQKGWNVAASPHWAFRAATVLPSHPKIESLFFFFFFFFFPSYYFFSPSFVCGEKEKKVSMLDASSNPLLWVGATYCLSAFFFFFFFSVFFFPAFFLLLFSPLFFLFFFLSFFLLFPIGPSPYSFLNVILCSS